MNNKKLDLGYGNPGFLQELWPEHNLLKTLPSKILMPYGHGKQIMPSLEEAIKELHRKYKNVLINDSTKIVITVGAVQALQAGLSYYKSQGFNKIYIPHPFWGRFKDFTDLHHLEIVQSLQSDSFSLITSPNNPNGVDFSQLPADIRDACYNWPHYNKNVGLYSDPMSIFSLSKLSGHSSTRIGWAVVQDPDLAKHIKNYVNVFTSGVSIESQGQALEVIKDILNNEYLLTKSQEVLEYRLNLLKEIIKDKNLPITELSSQGMFWYIQTVPELIQDLNIECSKSEDFFDPIPNCFRLNLGIETVIFEEFLKRFKALR